MYITVKIYEYTNKRTVLQCSVFTIKILGLRHVFTLSCGSTSGNAYQYLYKKNYITVFPRALHRSLCWANWIQVTTSQHISVKHSLVLFCHLYSVHSIALDAETCVSGWGHDCDEIMLHLWQNFVWWLFKSVGIWLCIVGWAVLCMSKDCIPFTIRIWIFLKMSGTACPLTHCCIPEDLSLNNTGVRTWSLALYLMFMLILLDIWM